MAAHIAAQIAAPTDARIVTGGVHRASEPGEPEIPPPHRPDPGVPITHPLPDAPGTPLLPETPGDPPEVPPPTTPPPEQS